MHAYVIARGQKDHLKKWIDDLSNCYLPYEYEKGKYGSLQIGVRPVVLLEIAFPEKEVKKALELIGAQGTYPQYEWILKPVQKILRLLGLRQAPKVPRSDFVKNEAVGLHFLGLKKDKYINGIEQI